MNETTDPNNHILIVAIIAFYWAWALLGNWGRRQPRPGEDKAKREDAPTGQRAGNVQDTTSCTAPLDVIREIDPAAFLAGAKAAYEVIVLAYADSDIQILKRHVAPEVLETFERAIAERRDREEMLEVTFIGTSEATVVSAVEEDDTAEIAVRFVSEMLSVTRSAKDAIVAGDPQQIIEVIDEWTFASDTRSRKRNWILIATEGG